MIKKETWHEINCWLAGIAFFLFIWKALPYACQFAVWSGHHTDSCEGGAAMYEGAVLGIWFFIAVVIVTVIVLTVVRSIGAAILHTIN